MKTLSASQILIVLEAITLRIQNVELDAVAPGLTPTQKDDFARQWKTLDADRTKMRARLNEELATWL